jgi:hypothetical protein
VRNICSSGLSVVMVVVDRESRVWLCAMLHYDCSSYTSMSYLLEEGRCSARLVSYPAVLGFYLREDRGRILGSDHPFRDSASYVTETSHLS